MNKVTSYVCEHCHKSFTTAADCAAHEDMCPATRTDGYINIVHCEYDTEDFTDINFRSALIGAKRTTHKNGAVVYEGASLQDRSKLDELLWQKYIPANTLGVVTPCVWGTGCFVAYENDHAEPLVYWKHKILQFLANKRDHNYKTALVSLEEARKALDAGEPTGEKQSGGIYCETC